MNKLSVMILCTNTAKGTKSLGSIGLLKLNNKKNIIDYHINNIKLCWPDCNITVVGRQDDIKLNRYITNEKPDIDYVDYELDDMSNECESLLRGVNSDNYHDDFFIIDVNCLLDKNIFKKFAKYDMSESFIVHNKDISYESKLGCIYDMNSYKIQNIFFDLPVKILKYYYICNAQLIEILKSKPTRSKFLFETLNHTNNHINMYNIKTKKCININSIKDYKTAKETNFV